MTRVSSDNTYKKYLLSLLMVILAFNYVDRIVLGVVLQDIKLALSLTDTQLGLLSGIAFAAFYSIMGIPIARWADRGNRVMIISLTAAVWSVTVALCGTAQGFLQLLLIRIGVGVGEAGCIPPAHSLIADEFSRHERPRAVALYMLGPQLALTIGYFSGGWLNQFFGWRATFVLVGLPGLALAVLARLTLNEPRYPRVKRIPFLRKQEVAPPSSYVAGAPSKSDTAPPSEVRTAASPGGSDFKTVFLFFWMTPAFRNLLLCFSVWYFFGYGILQWEPTFFLRSYGMRTGEVGSWFALIFGLVGGVCVYYGGVFAERYAAGNERLQLNGCAAAFALSALVTAGAFLVANKYLAFGLLAVSNLGNLCQGPILATIQTLVPPRMRAVSLAVIYLFANLIGMGFGPLAAGALSDGMHRWFGDESLRYALLILCPGYFWAAWHLWRAGRTVARDVAAQTRMVNVLACGR